MTTLTLVDGHITFAEVTVTNMTRSEDFYHRVLGWSFAKDNADWGGANVGLAGTKSIVGLWPADMDPETDRFWEPHLKVADVHYTAGRIVAMGGSLIAEPQEVEGFGDMVIARLPSGSRLCLFSPLRDDDGSAVAAQDGHIAWAELMTTKHDDDVFFLMELFDAQPYRLRTGKMTYTTLLVNGEETFGVCQDLSHASDEGGYWRLYFQVPDVDEAAQVATENGGTILYGPIDSPFGRVAYIWGPDQEQLGLLQSPAY